MKLSNVIALVLVGSANAIAAPPAPDACQQVADKLAPVLRDQMKQASDTEIKTILDRGTVQCRARPQLDTKSTCVLAAADRTAVTACYTASLKANEIELGAENLLRTLGDAASEYQLKHRRFPASTAKLPTPSCCTFQDQLCAPTAAMSRDKVWTTLGVSVANRQPVQLSYRSDGVTFTAVAVFDASCTGHPVSLMMQGFIKDDMPHTEMHSPPPQ